MSVRAAVLVSFLCFGVLAASGAELTSLDPGGRLVNREAGELPATLGSGDRVVGPATVTCRDGSVLTLGKGAVLELLPGEEDDPREMFFLVSGSLRGEIGGATEIALPIGYFAGPKEGKALVYLEAVSKDRALFRVDSGRGLVATSMYHFLLANGQAVELSRVPGQPDAVDFETLPSNDGRLVQIARVSTPLEILLSIPPATFARIEQIENASKTRVSVDPSSQGGDVDIVTFRDKEMAKKGQVGPGTFAIIDNLTGEITFEVEEVDFAAVRETISLTSEFAVLALSNYNHLWKKRRESVTPTPFDDDDDDSFKR